MATEADFRPMAVKQGADGLFRPETILAGRNATVALTIPSGQTLSNAADLEGHSLVALVIPAGWDGGNITIRAADTLGGTYQDVYDSTGTIVTLTVLGASRVVALTGTHLQAVSSLRFIKLQAASAVAADRAITLIDKG